MYLLFLLIHVCTDSTFKVALGGWHLLTQPACWDTHTHCTATTRSWTTWSCLEVWKVNIMDKDITCVCWHCWVCLVCELTVRKITPKKSCGHIHLSSAISYTVWACVCVWWGERRTTTLKAVISQSFFFFFFKLMSTDRKTDASLSQTPMHKILCEHRPRALWELGTVDRDSERGRRLLRMWL